MCERFAQVWDEELGGYVEQWIGPLEEATRGKRERDPRKDYNVSAGDQTGVLVMRDSVVLEWMQWGLPGKLVTNLDLEAVPQRSLRSVLRQRVAVPMTGFYEWRVSDGQPFFFHRQDGNPVLVAGTYDVRRVHHHDEAGTALLVGAATRDMADLHRRLPLVVEPDDLTTWLDPDPRAGPSGAVLPNP